MNPHRDAVFAVLSISASHHFGSVLDRLDSGTGESRDWILLAGTSGFELTAGFKFVSGSSARCPSSGVK